MQRHHLLPVVVLGQVLVVGAAHHPDVARRMVAATPERPLVMELELAACFAAAPKRIHECALTLVPGMHGTPDCRRDLA